MAVMGEVQKDESQELWGGTVTRAVMSGGIVIGDHRRTSSEEARPLKKYRALWGRESYGETRQKEKGGTDRPGKLSVSIPRKGQAFFINGKGTIAGGGWGQNMEQSGMRGSASLKRAV